MKKITTLLLFTVLTISTQANDNIISIRNLFYNATTSADSANALFEKLQTVTINSKAELIAYKGMSCLIVCYHSFNPYIKYKNFVNGKNLLEQDIKKDPNNIELRFLRLSVQLNVPPFLGYSSNINEDKLIICNGIKNIRDKDLFSRIYNYTMNSKRLTAQEKEKMKDAIAQNKYISNTL
jgi:hypothetical protein